MRIAKINKNDIVNGEDICVTVFVQGCEHHCPGCHNLSTWDYDGGEQINDLRGIIIKALTANGITRNFSLSGGDPLAPLNVKDSINLVKSVRIASPKSKIFVWTGYVWEDIINNDDYLELLDSIDVLIDGPFVKELKDLTLWLRGSSNQRVIDVKESLKENKIIEYRHK